jgi:hypothetical protein
MNAPHLRPVRNLYHIDRDTAHRWSKDDADPILEFLRRDITDSGWSTGFLAERAGVAWATVDNIRTGKTRRPQNMTVDLLLDALGWSRTPVPVNRRTAGRT